MMNARKEAVPRYFAVIALDFGKARVGVAVSDELGILAHPRPYLDATNRKALLAEVAREHLVGEGERDRVHLGRVAAGEQPLEDARLQLVAAPPRPTGHAQPRRHGTRAAPPNGAMGCRR